MCPNTAFDKLAELIEEQQASTTHRKRTDSEKSIQSEVKRLPVFRNTQIRLRKAKIVWERNHACRVKMERSRSLSMLQQFTLSARRRSTL